jgi:hypothetical protein
VDIISNNYSHCHKRRRRGRGDIVIAAVTMSTADGAELLVGCWAEAVLRINGGGSRSGNCSDARSDNDAASVCACEGDGADLWGITTINLDDLYNYQTNS